MTSKADRTTLFILKTVAPIFNKKGYAATSLSDITKATGLTKGAIYGNFKNKESLALLAFDYNTDKILSKIEAHISKGTTPLERLINFVNFYREYINFTNSLGGCPIINTGIDAQNTHPLLLNKVKEIIKKMERYMHTEIEAGKELGEIRKTIYADVYSKRFFSLIQGAVLMSQTTGDTSYTTDCVNVILDTINQRFKAS